VEPKEGYHTARWELPSLPADLPANVTRIFGSAKLRHNHTIHALVFSIDGKRLASAGQDGKVVLWDAETGRELLTYNGHKGEAVRAVAFSPDGKMIASAADKEIHIWNPDDGKDMKTLQGHKDFINSVAFSSDSKFVASGGNDNLTRIHEVESGALKNSLEGHAGMINGVAFSADGHWLASVDGKGMARIWDVRNNYAVHRAMNTHPKGIQCVAFSQDSTAFATGSVDHTAKVYDISTFAERQKFEIGRAHV